MRKIINSADTFVQDTMEGIIAAYGDKVKLLNDDFRVLLSNYPTQDGKVGIVTAGGSGHLPVFLGYVGKGLLDGCAVGEVFASPASEKMADMIRACDRGNGVLCLFGNYNGDIFNFRMACDEVEFDDIETRQVLVRDDVASSPKENADKRRGVAGMVYAFKVAGAAADKMMSLDEVAAVAEKALANIRTMGVALSPCIVPKVGKPTFTIADDEIEIGMGIHGEAGIEVKKMMTADEIAETLVSTITKDMPLSSGDEVSVMVNGLGGTPMEEQLIVYRRVHQLLKDMGVTVVMPHIGEYATSMEMAGLSVTIFKLDAELKELLQAPAESPFYTNSNK
ncbi:dihydroxyacetone kinase subunit DhaK [Pseudoflavonifractor sp. An85]|uniref:dihydroxyacetone kinase subunit DhaK n=1 Tax=Pseudoflavonifractor sp. An85 TaxID=1965661 RepID=UPI000B39BE16|nr:dihydroxyacetone kinase subunit DhaK [Pseudoflavonifractor sp. An85]OUN25690.1 dihydroxyacetone kinase subunit DhaK [Pseudoflavonifractor sp. An85]